VLTVRFDRPKGEDVHDAAEDDSHDYAANQQWDQDIAADPDKCGELIVHLPEIVATGDRYGVPNLSRHRRR
jgi:hypothetical protein